MTPDEVKRRDRAWERQNKRRHHTIEVAGVKVTRRASVISTYFEVRLGMGTTRVVSEDRRGVWVVRRSSGIVESMEWTFFRGIRRAIRQLRRDERARDAARRLGA